MILDTGCWSLDAGYWIISIRYPASSIQNKLRNLNSMPCPLCQHAHTQPLSTPDKKYYKCPQCWLIYLDKEFHPGPTDEKKRYEEHNNDLSNQGYVDFLYQVIDPALPYLHNLKVPSHHLFSFIRVPQRVKSSSLKKYLKKINRIRQ